ncbi:pectinesterase family protein [Arcicella aquatica]|uniref:Pectinesterase n=1 Tax=Arcicella aquatica TaxID=217141 RepID=A0ABU5QPS9_9BACT|nr:pectinesterase family protein [Arcicella aquatica]MEA5259080.1 pectinesterase family protein [Arcicella aquatica]
MKTNHSYTFIVLLCLISFFGNSQALKIQHDLVVAKDGSGDFRYIQDAIDAVRVYLPNQITIRIKKGIYKEKVTIPSTLSNIAIIGEDSTVISYNDFSGKGKMETFDSYTLRVLGNDITLENLIIENTAGRVGQAVALHIEGDRCVIKKCSFLGNQDTIFAAGDNSRQHFVDCYIEGTVDFIFGSATVLFENCVIHSKTNGYVTATSTPKWVNYGYVFKNCKLTASADVNKVYLGRPWRSYAKTVFINCQLGKHILPEGWDPWGKVENEKTTFYAEYGSTGEGAKTDARVGWSHQLTEKQISEYTLENIFSGNPNPALNAFWHQPAHFGITGKVDTSYSNYSAYLNSKKSHPVTEIVPEKSLPSVLESKNITYGKIGNRALLLDVFSPKKKSEKPLPAVMIIHGGGWRTGNRTQHYQLARRLAEQGYVCFTPEYRLSTEALYPAAVHDLKTALRWMRENATEWNIDVDKIAVLGFSAGGELASFMGVTAENPTYEGANGNLKFSSKVQAIVDIDGTLSFVHPESGEGNDSKGTSAATYWFGYPKKDNPQLWDEASPLFHVGANTPPTLFLNSSVDRMHAGRDDFRKVLDQYKIYSEVHTFADAPHSFCLFNPWFEPTVKYISAFLKKTLAIK